MKYAIWPFYSQHDKITGHTVLKTCGATRHMEFIAKNLVKLGHTVVVAVPADAPDWPDHFTECIRIPLKVPVSNAIQRVHWNTTDICRVFDGADIAICNHEYMAIPVRAMFPSMHIVQMCATEPFPLDMFWSAWRRADLIVVHSEAMKRHFASSLNNVSIWPMTYDEDRLVGPDRIRYIDILFVQRCSSTNYTCHEQFLEVLPELPGTMNVAFTDVTRYLRTLRPELQYTADYVTALKSSKVAIALNDDHFGGQAIREAIVCGCVPLVRDASCYRELCGFDWPHIVKYDLSNLRDAIIRAVASSKITDCSIPLRNAQSQSYQKCWPKIKEDLRA